MKHVVRSLCSPAAATALLLAAGGCMVGDRFNKARFERTVELTRPAAESGSFRATTSNGSISLRGADSGEIRLTATITGRASTQEKAQELAEATEVLLIQEGTLIKTDIVRPKMSRGESIRVAFEGTLPQTTAAELHTSNGSIKTADLHGAVHAETSNGSVKLQNIRGDVDAHSSNGRVTLSNIDAGQITIKTSNGSIEGTALRGRVTASTSNGSVHMAFAKEADPHLSAELTSSNGSITLTVPAAFSGQVDASTSTGKIRTDLPVTVQGPIGKSLKGTVGGGAGTLKLRTSNGSIQIKCL